MALNMSAFEDEVIGSTQKVSTKNKVDVVFVIDNSGSMSPVIEGVKKHVKDFARTLKNNNIDFRIGFVIHDMNKFYIKEFTDNADDFIDAVEQTNMDGYDEMTLVAIDRGSEFPWDTKRHKFIVHFTDEAVETGAYIDMQREGLDELIAKLEDKHIKFYHFGEHCDEYESFKRARGTFYQVLQNFDNVNFLELMDKMAQSITNSASTEKVLQSQNTYNKSVYDLGSLEIKEVYL